MELIMKDKVKLLQLTGSWQEKTTGGIAAFLFNYFQHMDENRFDIDILTIAYPNFKLYEEKIEARGGKLYCLNVRKFRGLSGKIRYLRAFRKYLSKQDYDIIHINQGSYFTVLLCSLYAKIFGRGAKVISHSHSNLSTYAGLSKFMISLTKPLFYLSTDYFLACAHPAGEYMFPKRAVNSDKFAVMKNAIDMSSFSYNPQVRQEVREELAIGDRFVVGHVGRISPVKNHVFQVEIFYELKKMIPDSLLVLIGFGDEDYEEKVRAKVASLGLVDHVLFLGVRSDVARLMQALDVFVLPSHYEGLALVTIEAQTSGLPVVATSALPDEAVVAQSFSRLPVSWPARDWAKEIVELTKDHQRQDGSQAIIEAGYDIIENARKLEDLYLSLLS